MIAIKNIAARACLVRLGAIFSSYFLATAAYAMLPIEHWRAPNGAQVWLIHSPGIPMVDVQIALDGGRRRDSAEQAGLSHAVALMSGKGVQASGSEAALDENALGEAWADLGAQFVAEAGRDSFSYTLRALTQPDLLARAADLAARQMGQPSWPDDVWHNERSRWAASLREADTRPPSVANKALVRALYSGHPYGQQPTEATLARIHTRDLQAWHQRFVAACRAKVSIVGALDRAQAQALVERLLARLPQPAQAECAPFDPVPDAPDLSAAQQLDIPFNSAQAQVLVGQVGVARRHPDYLALVVGNHILGGGGFTSRLTEEVREKRGLTYGVYSYFSAGLNRGAFAIQLQTRPDQAAQALQVTRDTLARYVAEGPSEEELRAAKDFLTGSFALRLDSNRKLLVQLAEMAWFDLPLDELEHWTARVQALTTAQVREALQRHLQPQRMLTVVVGAKP